MADTNEINDAVREHYANAARRAGSRCEPVVTGEEAAVFGAGRYDPTELAGLPDEVAALSIGCANPVVLAELASGEVVLDLGSGGGIDVLLSARRVGPTGKAYGLDFTDEMLDSARANQAKAGAENVEFLKGRIESVPLPDQSVDVVISNCVINLSSDKPAVFAETFRVLRPGGRLAVADVVADAEVGDDRRADAAAWVDCLAGAQTRGKYRATLEAAGFVKVSITDSHPVADGFTSVLVRAGRARGVAVEFAAFSLAQQVMHIGDPPGSLHDDGDGPHQGDRVQSQAADLTADPFRTTPGIPPAP